MIRGPLWVRLVAAALAAFVFVVWLDSHSANAATVHTGRGHFTVTRATTGRTLPACSHRHPSRCLSPINGHSAAIIGAHDVRYVLTRSHGRTVVTTGTGRALPTFRSVVRAIHAGRDVGDVVSVHRHNGATAITDGLGYDRLRIVWHTR